MKFIFIVIFSLLTNNLLGQEQRKFFVRSDTRNDVHIKVWIDGILINDHIMKTGDRLEIKSTTGCWIWMEILGNYCDPECTIEYKRNSNLKFNKGGSCNYDISVPQNMFSTFWNKRGLTVNDGPCPKPPQA